MTINLEALEAAAKAYREAETPIGGRDAVARFTEIATPETIQALCEVVRAAQSVSKELDDYWEVVGVNLARARSTLDTALEPFREKGEG